MSRCPSLFRIIVKRYAMTGSRLGRYAENGQPPGFSRGGGPIGKFPTGLFPENFQPDFPEKMLVIFFKRISGKI